VLIKNFGLLDSRWALILPYISAGIAFATLVLRSFFDSLPEELFEATRIDGASEVQVFWYLGLPLIRPAVATVAILQILGTWNDYIWPSVVLYSNANFTIPIGLVAFEGQHITQWGPLMACYTLAAVPLVALFAVATRSFIDSLVQGGLKI
jgi:ABC-type glycerol-3-phosphate transport system permease component